MSSTARDVSSPSPEVSGPDFAATPTTPEAHLADDLANRPEHISVEEWRARIELAAAYRVFDHLGWIELIYNHITLRVPGPDVHFLINPFGLMYSEVTASNLVKIDLEGNKVSPSPWDINPAGFIIHSAIHGARDDAHCIMHTHTDTGMAIACQEQGLVNDNFYTSAIMDELSYHDFEGITTEYGERERLVEDLGTSKLMILRNHGLLTCGVDVADAFLWMWQLQRACDIQYAARSVGRTIAVTGSATQQSMRSINEVQGRARSARLVFNAMRRLIDRKDPGYRS